MRFGVCGSPEMGQNAADANFDYFEWSVPGLLKPLEDESEFRQSLALVKETGIPCPVLNLMVPAQLKLTGPEVDIAALRDYINTMCQRAEEAGVKVIVFGSGGARQIPHGYSRNQAWDQLVKFCRMLGPVAQDHGVTIAIEPLNKKECNVVNSVAEGAELARQTDNPAIRLLVDAYHWAIDEGTINEILDAGDLLVHAHIATRDNRRAPGIGSFDFNHFFQALQQTGYDSRISIEAQIDDPGTELPLSLGVLKTYVNG